MSTVNVQLDAGGLVRTKAKVDTDATEQVVARTYRHRALGNRSVIRLASDRLGQAEDLAMEFLGFEAPVVSTPLALQQRRSLGFAHWALINDPANARFALDLVKRMKATARRARSKPGHAWDAYADMAKELGRSARHFLPPFWEDAGRAFKDVGNQTYAGRALNKSLEAERVHALESDRARRRDVVLEFVLSGCLSGTALSDYANDLQAHYSPPEAIAIFRDLSVRRTRGGMSPWATLPKDFTKLAKAAGLDSDAELEQWLEEVIEAPAMGRAPHQFWKTCSENCKRIVARNSRFPVALLRHTRPEPRYYGESKLGPWLELLEEWGVLDYLWVDGHLGAPPLGEPVATWFARIVQDEVPAPKRTLQLLENLTPRLKKEDVALELSTGKGYRSQSIDVDVLEACLTSGIKVANPPPSFAVTFSGWLTANVNHRFRNQDVVESPKDERFHGAVSRGLEEALACRGGATQRGYRQANLEQRAFPLAAGDRPGVTKLWHRQAAGVVTALEQSGLASFESALERLRSTLWPDTLRLFPDLAERLQRVDDVAMLERTLRAGIFDEYGWHALEHAVDQDNLGVHFGNHRQANVYLTFPTIVVSDKVHAHVFAGDGTLKKYELRLPSKSEINRIISVGEDLAVNYRDQKYQGHFYWVSDPGQQFDGAAHWYSPHQQPIATLLEDGSVFLGQRPVRTGDKQMPEALPYVHDGKRFWRLSSEYDRQAHSQHWKIRELDLATGKEIRDSVPPWFEETEGGTIELDKSTLGRAPAGTEDSPLGTKDGMLGWKAVKRREGSYFGIGIDGRRWDKPLIQPDGSTAIPVALLRQPGTQEYLPVTTGAGHGQGYSVWDSNGSTTVAALHDFGREFAEGQIGVLPLCFWHLLRLRDAASSRKLRQVSRDECAELLREAAVDRTNWQGTLRGNANDPGQSTLTNLVRAVTKLLPGAPARMVWGIARIVERAERDSTAFTDLRDKAGADATKETADTTGVVNRQCDLAASRWGMKAFHHYGRQEPISISEHLTAAAEFLKGDSKGCDLPRTNYLWFSMLENLSLRSWQTFWGAQATRMTQKHQGVVAWLEFLKLWHDVGIADLPGRFDFMEGHRVGAKKNQWGGYDTPFSAGVSYGIRNGEDRFIVVESDSHQLPYQFLRYSTAKVPGTAPGYEIDSTRQISVAYDAARVAAFIAAVEASTALPLPAKDELDELAASLSVSPAEIGLIWLGGLNVDSYQASFLPTELRTALGWKSTEASAARQALRNINRQVLADLYEAVISEGCAAPFAADRKPVLRRIAEAWRTKMPRRLELDAALQTRLSALASASRWQRQDHELLLAAAAEPGKHPLLQPQEMQIGLKTDAHYPRLELGVKNHGERFIDSGLLRSIVQLVSLVHAQTPSGHAARPAMPALIKQTTKLLDHSSTLLQLRTVYVHDPGGNKSVKPSGWLNKQFGKTKSNAKDGLVHFDDGLLVAAALDTHHQAIIAFRPARLRDDADLARLQGVLASAGTEQLLTADGSPEIILAIRSSGFQKLVKSILAKDVPKGAWPQNPLTAAASVVQAIQKKYKLAEDAAVLYAQMLALPDPTTSNVCTWNDWNAARVKKASAELVGRKLVLEATRARAGRSVFLPGEWMELKAPWLPIERWKLSHLVERDGDRAVFNPVGGPMALRPFEDLFSAAWQRVFDGDAPRYEEVKRKKKK
jgi:hypothetical protein